MMGTRFMVLELKQILRTILFVIAGAALILLLIFFLFPKDEASNAKYEPGIYTATLAVPNQQIEVSVTVSKTNIISIELVDLQEVQEVFYPLIKPTLEILSSEIIKEQVVEVDLPLDSEMTGKLLLEAIQSALKQATI